MIKSALQVARAAYQPKLPQALKGAVVAVEGAATQSVGNQEEIKAMFPNTYGMPVITFEAGEQKPMEAFNVGIILSGGQAPGGHNVISGLYDGVKSLNPNSKLYGFLMGPGGLVDHKYVEFNDEFIDEYRNTGGFDIIGSGRTKLEKEAQFESGIEILRELGIKALVIIGGDDSNTNACVLAEYYAAIFFQIDFRSVKLGLKGLSRAELEDTRELMRHSGYLFLPLIILVVMLATGITVTKAGLYTIGATFVISLFRKESRITPAKFVSMCCDAAKGGITVAVACGLVGVMMGTLTLTGLGFRLSNMLVSLSHGSLVLLLILCMITSLIMGMGLPSLACYVLLATLVAPALIRMNVEPIAAHLFLFYFGIIGNVTPPVAGAAYCAAGIAQSNPMKTGIQAFLLSISGFLIPYVFAFNPALVMVGFASYFSVSRN